jgi:hypothetical protein
MLSQGYMVGPTLGGILFHLGGFATPFVVLGFALLPAAALIYYRLPPDDRRRSNDEIKGEVSMKARSPSHPLPPIPLHPFNAPDPVALRRFSDPLLKRPLLHRC